MGSSASFASQPRGSLVQLPQLTLQLLPFPLKPASPFGRIATAQGVAVCLGFSASFTHQRPVLQAFLGALSMDIWTISAILVGAVVVALVLAYVLKSRLRDADWQELEDLNAPPEVSESSVRPFSNEIPFVRAEDSPRQGVQLMSSPNSASPREAELRRSSRLENPVPLVVLGTNRRGETFQERTSALSFNLHGCRYSSRHDYPRESWVTLQVTGTDGAMAPPVRARVCSILAPQSPRELCQVGVELETPANIWGIASPPEDWQRALGSTASAPRAAAAIAPPDPSSPLPAFLQQRPTAPPERRAEVAMFPGPAVPEMPAATKDSPAAKTERVTFTPEQLLQALQGKLQLAAERAVDTALSARLEESIQQAVAKIEEGWKDNLRHTEEFSAARLAEVQSRWERELVVYRSRAEEVSRRVETLAASSRQALTELQKFAERIKTEIEPQFNARVDASLSRASSDLEAKAAELAEQHKSKITEFAETAALQARSQLDDAVAEARSLTGAMVPPPAGVSEERLEFLMNSSRDRMEERLSDVWTQFEQQQDLVRHRADEFAQHLEMLSTQLNEAKALHEQALSDVRSILANVSANASPERLESAIKTAKEQIFNHVEWRLGEVSGRADQQHNAVQQRADEIFRRLDAMAADSANAHSQSQQSVAELRALLANSSGGISQQQLDSVLNSVREQLLNHFEWRLGEVSGEFEQQHDAVRHRSEELSQRFDAFAASVGGQLEEHQAKAETLIRELRPYDVAGVEQATDRAAKEFELSAARISDRQLVRLMQQKQALSTEASLELEARASETRALLQKAANNTLDDFRRRFETHIDLVIAEATERVASSLASLDAESRAACEARRRDVEIQVTRAAEQSTAEFRSGIKAFLYSCLVAAVSAVDEHAQSTLASLGKGPDGAPLALEEANDATNGSASDGASPHADPRT